MKKLIVWNGIEYNSVEHCVLDFNGNNIEINSTITGCYKNNIYKVEYHVTLNMEWQVLSAFVQLHLNGEEENIQAEKKQNNWLINGEWKNEYAGVNYIDISLSPFTNTLPVNGLHLSTNEPLVITVLYFNLLERKIQPFKQQYTRLDDEHYLYENFDKSFKAEITVDKNGFVTDYPALFTMACKKDIP